MQIGKIAFISLFKIVLSFRYAENIAIGDEVLIHTTAGMVPSKVEKIAEFAMRGEHLVN